MADRTPKALIRIPVSVLGPPKISEVIVRPEQFKNMWSDPSSLTLARRCAGNQTNKYQDPRDGHV